MSAEVKAVRTYSPPGPIAWGASVPAAWAWGLRLSGLGACDRPPPPRAVYAPAREAVVPGGGGFTFACGALAVRVQPRMSLNDPLRK